MQDVHPFPSPLGDTPKSEMNDEELRVHEQAEFAKGPMRVLTAAPILIHLRNDHRLLARVKAFDRHCNMVLEDVKEWWREGKGGKGRGKKRRLGRERERHVSKMFIRGDSVILVVKPQATA